MPLTAETVGFGPPAFEAVRRAIAAAQGANRLAPVSVIVPTNPAGVMLRRWLGRRGGVAGVNFLTMYRLAEMLAGGRLAADGRRPISPPILAAAVRAAVAATPGPLHAEQPHDATVDALSRLYRELRELDGATLSRLERAGSPMAKAVVAIHRRTRASLAGRWHDESDLLTTAAVLADGDTVTPLGPVLVALPRRLTPSAGRLLKAISLVGDVHLIVGIADDEVADAPANELLSDLGVNPVHDPSVSPTAHVDLHSATDADDEVRVIIRRLLDAARSGIPFDRMAVLWTTSDPYVRTLGEQLDAAGIPWNGVSPVRPTERVAPRALLQALHVDRRGWRRRDVFELLTGVPVVIDGRPAPAVAWERVARQAGVVAGSDWDERLDAFARRSAGDDEEEAPERSRRQATLALGLRACVLDLERRLGDPADVRPWAEWVEASHGLVRHLLGGERHRRRLPADEQRTFDALEAAIDRLVGVDDFLGPVDRATFRRALANEVDSQMPRRNHIGTGVFVGPLSASVALDSDVIAVLGATDGSLPARPSTDPLLNETDRHLAGIVERPGDLTAAEQRRCLLVAIAGASQVLLGVARGDLRRSAGREPSRWIDDLRVRADVHEIHHASHADGLAGAEFPVHPSEFLGRSLLSHVRAGAAIDDHPLAASDPVIAGGLRLIRARQASQLTEYDGDLSGLGVPTPFDGATRIAPTRLERWIACPHGYFMRHVLHVDADVAAGDDLMITPMERGSLVHAALERFLTGVLDDTRGPWPADRAWSVDHRRAAHLALDEVADERAKSGVTGHPSMWAYDLAGLHGDLDGWLATDDEIRAETGRVLVGTESPFGADDDAWPAARVQLPGGRAVVFRGVIDRVERELDGALAVTDLKTGRADRHTRVSQESPLGAGVLLQLGAYAAAAAAAHDHQPIGVHAEYRFIDRVARRRRSGFQVTPEVWTSFTEALAVIADAMAAGMFPARPDPPTFQFYISCRYCDPDGAGTDERHREWMRKRDDPRLSAYLELIGAETDTPAPAPGASKSKSAADAPSDGAR